MKKLLSILLVAAMMITTVGCSETTPAESTDGEASVEASVEASAYEFVRIGTASLGGNFYNFGSALSQLVIEKMGYDASSQATNGSAQNCYLVRDGEVEMAIAQGNTIYEAITSAGNFEGENFDSLRGLGIISFNAYHVLVHEDANIQSLEDLKGKKIAMGPVGGGVEVSARKFLSFFGINDGDYTPIYGTVGEMHEQMKTGQIDAYINAVGAGTAQTTDTLSDEKISLLMLTKEQVDSFLEANPDLGQFTVPAGTYAELTEDMYTCGPAATIFANEDMPEDFAYEFTKNLYTQNEFLMSYNSGFVDALPENATSGMVLEWHPGAAKYLKEIGILQ